MDARLCHLERKQLRSCQSIEVRVSLFTMAMHRMVVGIVLSAVALSCSGSDNPTLVDLSAQFALSYCEKLSECIGSAAFEQAFPGGHEYCASLMYRIYGTDERSVCSQATWDRCMRDLEAGACILADNVMVPEIPDSCQGC